MNFITILSTLLLSFPLLSSAAKKTVSFGPETNFIEADKKPVGILRTADRSSRSGSRPIGKEKRKQSDFDSDEDSESDDDFAAIFSRTTPDRKSEKSHASARSSSQPRSSSPQTHLSRRESPPSRQVSKKPKTGLSRFKDSLPIANPILDVIFGLMNAFVTAYNDGPTNEFISDEGELEILLRRQGIRLKDPSEMLLRISRPTIWLALHMWSFYSFPFEPMFWGAMLIVDLLIILGWRQYDIEWMQEETVHWDYLLGLGVFAACGVVSLVHQGVNFLSQVFFALAPGLVLFGYILFLLYAAFQKPHHYYY